MSATTHLPEEPTPSSTGGSGFGAADLVGLIFLAALAVVVTRLVDGAAPVIAAAALGALIPRREEGKSAWATRAPLAIVSALIALFVVKMWPLAAGELPDTSKAPWEPAHLLSWLLAVPVLGALVVLVLPRSTPGILTGFTLTVMAITLAVALPILGVPMGRTYHFNHDFLWMPRLGVHYHVAIDGISLWLVMLTVFIMPIAAYVSFGSITTRIKDWCFALLLLEAAMIGTFVALDLFLFYALFELTLVPMYVMIGVWGGSKRIYATLKFFLFTFFGSLLMLAAVLYIGYAYQKVSGAPSFDYFDLQRLMIDRDTQVWLFAAFSLAFFIKVPMFPVHTWLPDAHTEAPTAGSIILAAVMLKMGTYGYLRFCLGIFPEAANEWGANLGGVAVLGIIYGALCAWRQTDVKRLVAYSSVAHLGYVMLGIFAATQASLEGSVLQMVNHGITTGALFLLVGVIYDRRHTRDIEQFGGLAKVMPVYTTLFLVATMASIGLPATNGFVGEFMIITGTFVSTKLGHVAGMQAVGAAIGVILGALYMLSMVQRVFFGPITKKANLRLKDINNREILAVAPLIAMIFVIGLFPRIFLDPMRDAVTRIGDEYGTRLVTSPGPKYHVGSTKLFARSADAPPAVAPDPAPLSL